MRPGTSLFYEPSAAKPDNVRQPINMLEQALVEENQYNWNRTKEGPCQAPTGRDYLQESNYSH